MSDTCVWVQTSVLQKAFGGGTSAPTKKGSAAVDYERTGGDWSWTRTIVISGDISAVATNADEFTSSLNVKIIDENSDFNEKQVELKANLIQPDKKTGHHYVVMANEWETPSAADEDQQPPDDLITLTHLHEPAVVHALRKRYDNDIIYTSTGPILLALNPFKQIPSLYDDKVMSKYWAAGEGVTLEEDTGDEGALLKPHIYGNADKAFRNMMLNYELKKSGIEGVMVDQSILVSGESGAGKTVATKHIMKYLATLSQRKAEHAKSRQRSSSPGRTEVGVTAGPKRGLNSSMKRMSRTASWKAGAQVEERILNANPILESFGNARTVRNDNSSRFGKFIELQFKQTGSLIGAKIDTYLLETVRLIHQGSSERNFHIFYELLAAATKDERDMFFLKNYTEKDFKMTNSSGCYTRRDGVNDADMFDELTLAMSTMGFDSRVQDDIFKVSMAFLHASNLQMIAVTDDSSKVDDTNVHLTPVLKLLGLGKEALQTALCEYEIEAYNSTYAKTLSKEFAEKGLEALVKTTYKAMFSFIVQTVNKKIEYKIKRGEPAFKKLGFIGVLDIFGFESFQDNSFEQLCINYCNETLQQQFNLYIFKTEQKEYQSEGIDWDFIEFPDNQDVIDLIEKKGVGIIPILTDQCRNLRGTDKSFADQMYQSCTKHERFDAAGLIKANGQFVIMHYAGPVKYDSKGFVEKNKSEIPRNLYDLLINSKNPFVQLLGKIAQGPSDAANNKKGAKKRPTVGGTFSAQLLELRKRIDLTSPHYVRCLKPNQSLAPDDYKEAMIADQLRYAGVLEAIRVSRVGYSQRYPHKTFLARYRFIAGNDVNNASSPDEQVDVLVHAIADKIWKAENPNKAPPADVVRQEGVQKGKTKVFLRQHAFEYMERFRTQKLDTAATLLQAHVRGFIQRCRYVRYRDAVIMVQATIRGYIARKNLSFVRERRAASRIQNYYRMYVLRKIFLSKKFAALWLQKHERGRAERVRYAVIYKKYTTERNATIAIQCMYRSRKARDEYRTLRDIEKDRRSLEKKASVVHRYEAEKQKLENKAAKAQAIQIGIAQNKGKELNELNKELEKTKITAQEAEESKEEIAKLRKELKETQDALTASRKSAENALFKLAKAEAENTKLKEQMNEAMAAGGKVVPEVAYKSKTYEGHDDLREMDQLLFGMTSRAKQGKTDLDNLIQSLSILKTAN